MSEIHLKNNRIDIYAHAPWQDTMIDLHTSEDGLLEEQVSEYR